MEMDQLGGKIKKVGATSPLSHGLAYADTLDKIMLLDIAVFLDHWKKHSMRKLDLYIYLINFCIRVQSLQ